MTRPYTFTPEGKAAHEAACQSRPRPSLDLVPRIMPLWDKGLSVSLIAARLLVTKATISGLIHRHRALFPRRPKVKNFLRVCRHCGRET